MYYHYYNSQYTFPQYTFLQWTPVFISRQRPLRKSVNKSKTHFLNSTVPKNITERNEILLSYALNKSYDAGRAIKNEDDVFLQFNVIYNDKLCDIFGFRDKNSKVGTYKNAVIYIFDKSSKNTSIMAYVDVVNNPWCVTGLVTDDLIPKFQKSNEWVAMTKEDLMQTCGNSVSFMEPNL